MTQEATVVLQIFVASITAAVTFYFMQKAQKKKQADADAQYDFTMKLIEMRNKKHGDENEPKKTP